MKIIYFLSIGILLALSSCSSSKSAQNTEDGYYSPSGKTTSSASGQNEYYNANASDQYLMMRVQNPAMWSTFDNYDYGYGAMYSPYAYGGYGFYGGYSPYMGFGYWNPYYSYMYGYYAWNSFYNPYFGTAVIVGAGMPSYGYTYNQLHPGLGTYAGTPYRTGRSGLSPYSSTRGKFFTGNAPTNNFQNRTYAPATNRTNSFGTGSRSFGNGGGGRSFGRGGRGL